MSVLVERRRSRLAVRTGLSGISWLSVVAGVLAGYAAFAVFLGLASILLEVAGLSVALGQTDWGQVAGGAAFVGGVLVFLSWSFAGYFAGRMAQRSAAVHGVLIFTAGILVAFSAAVLAELSTEPSELSRRLLEFGVPASFDQWRHLGTPIGVLTVLGMLGGALAGGLLAQRFQSRAIARAIDDATDVRSLIPGLAPDDYGTRATRAVSNLTAWMGSFPAILFAVLLVASWLVGGFFVEGHLANSAYHLVIGSGTAVVTFLMVFIIQNTQNRDGRAIQTKLDAQLQALHALLKRFQVEEAGPLLALVGLEDASDEEIQDQQEDVRAAANELAAEERPAEAITLELLEVVEEQQRAEADGRGEDVERLARRIEELHARLAEVADPEPGRAREEAVVG